MRTELKTLSSWELGPFVKADAANPCLEPTTDSFFRCTMRGEEVWWEEKDVFNPAAIVHDGRVCLLYRAEDTVGQHAGTSRIGLAESEDGLHFTKGAEPVLYPGPDGLEALEWEGGCEDPRIVMDESGTYYITYTAYNGTIAILCIATSTDLRRWTKHGPVFGRAIDGKYANWWSKSGSIITRRDGDRLVAAKLQGKYWMYWGESDIFAATSEDLIHWTPVETEEPGENGEGQGLLSVMKPRPHRFDSLLIEPGPPSILTDRGIVLIYNSKNHADGGDPGYAVHAYCAGQALLDPANPLSMLDRAEDPFLVPDKDYEIDGQVNHVCFAEGLVYHQGHWLLYYGTADSKIAVARCLADL
ncbi:glycoside hydrolase family 130 protein [Cohnella sp. GCM10020058]|uniref:glycoside hydrolase family 130 protein n=1 Tax=Cohnella sp. GCM10020058 TaxID=3317330 RepID=UPI003625CB6D